MKVVKGLTLWKAWFVLVLFLFDKLVSDLEKETEPSSSLPRMPNDVNHSLHWRAEVTFRGTWRGCRNGVTGTLREIPQGRVQSQVPGKEVPLEVLGAGECQVGEWFC